MNRDLRVNMASATLDVLKRGFYRNSQGAEVAIESLMAVATEGTTLHEYHGSTQRPGNRVKAGLIEVTRESTVKAIIRLAASGNGHLSALNFASAKNPGGGFLGGAQAQEESLARSSGLYHCLLKQPEFYERHRGSRCLLYQDLAIFSPKVPFFFTDEGQPLNAPAVASIITCAAPNAGALADNQPAKLPLAPETFRRRAEFVLQLAVEKDVDTLILGAWGCGVFRNDPAMVAECFASLLKSGPFANAFDRVIFSIYDRSKSGAVANAFATQFGPAAL